MTKEEEANLLHLQTRVRQLILAHSELEAVCRKQEAELAEGQAREAALKDEIAALQKSYETLKTARILTMGSEDTEKARARVQALIREVDKCIALLNV